MKILMLTGINDDHMYQWQFYHFIDELERNGCTFNYVNLFDYSDMVLLNNNILKEVEEYKYDLFISFFGHKILFVDTLKFIKNKSIKTLLMCCDNLTIPYVHKKICKHFDLVWLTSYETKYLFDKWGAKTVFLPYAANPHYSFYEQTPQLIDRICFVGTPHGSRVNMINNLTKNHIHVDLYENKYRNTTNSHNSVLKIDFDSICIIFNFLRFYEGRKVFKSAIMNKILKRESLNRESEYLHFFESVPYSEMRQIYSKYRLSLSSSSYGNTWILKKPLDVVNLRSFEIPMCGGIQFIQYSDELNTYFENDEEIVFYKGKDDMIIRAKEYLYEKSDSEIIAIKTKVSHKSFIEYTWNKRFEEVFKILEINYNSINKIDN